MGLAGIIEITASSGNRMSRVDREAGVDYGFHMSDIRIVSMDANERWRAA